MALQSIAKPKAATSREYQENNEITCDLNKYDANEHTHLRYYIKYALCELPGYKKVAEDDANEVCMDEKKGAINLIDSIFNKVVEHGTQLTEDKEVLCRAIWCFILDKNSLSKYNLDKLGECGPIIPIFKVQKAIKSNDKNEKDVIIYQNWYVDNEAKVYESWDDYNNNYLTKNNLSTCTLMRSMDEDLKEEFLEIDNIKEKSFVNFSLFLTEPKDTVHKSIDKQINKQSPNTSTSNSNDIPTPISASTANSFTSENALEIYNLTLRNFCVQQNIDPSSREVATIDSFRTLIRNLPYFESWKKILYKLLKSTMSLVKEIMSANKHTILQFMTKFICLSFKSYVETINPRFLKDNGQFQKFIYGLLEKIYDCIKFHGEKWFQAFSNWLDCEMIEDKKNEIVNKDIAVLNPAEVMALSIKDSTMLIEKALKMTGSKMKWDERLRLPFLKFCDKELKDFFTKHPAKIECNFSDLSIELKNILFDLYYFEKKDIIFYKLIVIAVNIIQGLEENCVIKKDAFVNVMKYLWILVNINFFLILPNACINSNDNQNTVNKIVQAIYMYQVKESDKWLSAFLEYQEKYGKK